MTYGIIQGDLSDAVDKFGFGNADSIMDLKLYQWGNAYYNTTKCGVASGYDRSKVECWTSECGGVSPPADCFDKTSAPIMCQHGDNECLAMLFMDCVDSNYDAYTSFEFQLCNANSYNSTFRTDRTMVENANYDCALKVIGESRSIIDLKQCYMENLSTGNLWVDYAKKTAAFGTSRQGTPWIVIDGEHIADGVTVIKAVCDAYTGTKPAACSEHQLDSRPPIRTE